MYFFLWALFSFFMAYLSQLLAPTWWLVISEEDEPPRTRKQKISVSQKNSKNRLNCIETVARTPVQNYNGKTKEKAKAGHVKFFLCLKKLKVRSDVRFADVECINKIFINFVGCWPVFVGKLIFRNMSRQHMFKKIVKNSEYFSWQNISWQHFFQNYILAFPKGFLRQQSSKKSISFLMGAGV